MHPPRNDESLKYTTTHIQNLGVLNIEVSAIQRLVCKYRYYLYRTRVPSIPSVLRRYRTPQYRGMGLEQVSSKLTRTIPLESITEAEVTSVRQQCSYSTTLRTAMVCCIFSSCLRSGPLSVTLVGRDIPPPPDTPPTSSSPVEAVRLLIWPRSWSISNLCCSMNSSS